MDRLVNIHPGQVREAALNDPIPTARLKLTEDLADRNALDQKRLWSGRGVSHFFRHYTKAPSHEPKGRHPASGAI